ncbi:ANTAR domain-containing protein [Mycobacterium sp. 1423905.2]|uniref:ANTAR domain-containing protein n=1 Tax=Mycobacterium sp. 1423905.2 TaxID=1856859 RepID=UPI0007FF966B|nr:ANTAR domain-containing protein [Mycobacterium sp. 1423905.2]OBJ52395.1 hypothetical protein A9W95_20335 [Mycobacterium sp. 1423905.2]
MIDSRVTTTQLRIAEQARAIRERADDAVDLARGYANHAALAWATVRNRPGFGWPPEVRDLVSQAKGMLMERYDVGADDALALLKRLSDESKIPIAEVSRRLANRQRQVHRSRPIDHGKTNAGPRSLAHLSKDSAERRQMIREATRC